MMRSLCSLPVSSRRGVAWVARAVSLVVALTAASQPVASTDRSMPTAGLRVLEQAIETRAAELSLPPTGEGWLSVTPCRDCRPRALRTGAATRSFIDGAPVTSAVLRRTLLAEPEASVALFYRGASGEVTRILVTLPAGPARR
jgi:hypothetical protein